MKERPIIFSGEMIKAILAGNKTQTRRVMKPQLTNANGNRNKRWEVPDIVELCPYGRAGDRLWCKETWRYTSDRTGFVSNPNLEYRADYNGVAHTGKWRPPLFMPRRASRLTLEITTVCAERLWDITEEDAKKEGMSFEFTSFGRDFGAKTCRELFQRLWDSINGKKYPWSGNWWVWTLEFKRIES